MDNEIKISFLGDIVLNKDAVNLSDNDMKKVVAELTGSDYVIGNLEAPVCDELLLPIIKTGPNLKIGSSEVNILKKIGINATSLANNHIGDYGEKGVKNTLEILKSNGLFTIGAGNSIEEAYKELVINISGVSIAFIAVCENEFGMADYNKAGAAGYRIDLLVKTINRAKENAEYVIVLFHGGNEFNPLPNPDVQYRYRAIIDLGANAVIGTHPHCPQGYEYYNDGIICYSLGNFIFPDNSDRNPMSTWNLGYWANLIIAESGKIHLEIVPYYFYNCSVRLLTANNLAIFNQYINGLNSVISNTECVKKYFWEWVKHRGENYAKRLAWDKEVCDKYSYEIQNIFRCESHNSLVRTYYEILSSEEDGAAAWSELKELFIIRVDKKLFANEIIRKYKYYDVLNIDNIITFIKKSNVYICGAGKLGKSVYVHLLENNKRITFLDQNGNKGDYIGDSSIETYDYLKKIDNIEVCKFIIAVANKDMQVVIHNELMDYGIKKEQAIVAEISKI